MVNGDVRVALLRVAAREQKIMPPAGPPSRPARQSSVSIRQRALQRERISGRQPEPLFDLFLNGQDDGHGLRVDCPDFGICIRRQEANS
jgi:hypothetical protein